jgi:hypothetical protein
MNARTSDGLVVIATITIGLIAIGLAASLARRLRAERDRALAPPPTTTTAPVG